MSKLMEAKWREFREGNPLTRKREKPKEDDEKKKSEDEEPEEPR